MLAMGLSVTCLNVSFFPRFGVVPIGMFYILLHFLLWLNALSMRFCFLSQKELEEKKKKPTLETYALEVSAPWYTENSVY